jgi:hypothetical protein
MNDLSIVIVGRNDGYGDDKLTPYGIVAPDTFMIRLCRTIRHNLDVLNKQGISARYTVVDWSPIEKLMIDDNEFNEIHRDLPVDYVVVPNEIIVKKGYQSHAFHEYYAKNVGIIHSNSKYLIVTNPDDLLTEKIAEEISKVVADNLDGMYWRCHSRLDVNQQLEVLAEGVSFLPPEAFPGNELAQLEASLGCPAAGDFLLATRETLIKYGKGYDEENPNHRKTSQRYSSVGSYGGSHGGMDSEILTNLFFNGIKPVKMEGSIMHLDHAKPNREGGLLKLRYENIINWGFSDHRLSRNERGFFVLEEQK